MLSNSPFDSRVLKQIGPFTMKLDLSSDGISKPLYYQGYREACFMHLLSSEIKPGYVCIDLGSNIGYTTLYMCGATGPTGKVYAIEPDPWNIDLLRDNIKLNNFDDMCEITQCAVSNFTGELDFWMSDKSNLSSVEKTAHSTKMIRVKSYDLGTFLEGRSFPNFIKMDIEGHEVKVLGGAIDFFSKNEGPIKILLEVHPSMYSAENDFEKVLVEYFKMGFRNKYTVSTPIAVPRKFAEAGYKPVLVANTDGFQRGIYEEIKNEHFLEFSCRENIEGNSKKIVRSFMIERL